MSFFKKIVALICGEKEERYTGPCYFDLLFTKNVPHVLEQILFSLDYGSFKRCLRVNKAWNKLLNSESFQKKTRHIFQKEINLECERRLWKASKDGKVEEVRRLLLNKMLDVNHEEEEWWSDHDDSYDSWYFKDPYGPLSMAAKYGHEEVVSLLLDGGADPNKANPRGRTALHLAARRGHTSIAKTLIDRGAYVNFTDEHGQTPLHKAAPNYKVCKRVYKLLESRGANDNMRDKWNLTPCYYMGMSIASGHKNCY